MPKISKMQLFATPDDWDTIEHWIDLHPKEDRAHLWAAAGMTWNLAVEMFGPEAQSEQSEDGDG